MSKSSALHAIAFDHVTLVCADLEASRHFYVDLLGMQEVPRPAFSFPGRWFQLGRVQIHATQMSPEAGRSGWQPQAGTIVSRGHHIAFAVEDLPKALEVAEANGVRIASPMQERPDGYRQAYVCDPDGHIVELVSR